MGDITINEIRRRLQLFSNEHASDSDEKQHAQQFWRDFYMCFGLTKSSASMFEARVLKVGGIRGYIDSFIPGILLVEQKSLGRNLEDAYIQAQAYFHAIGNKFEKPRYIITCDFQTFNLYDLHKDAKIPLTCQLKDLSKHADWFMFLAEKEVHAVSEELPVNRKAAEQIAKLHDGLLRARYSGKDLEVFLTRLLFCLFADDTGIFGEDGQFRRLVEATREDGADLGSVISLLFQVLNTPHDKRQTNLDETLNAFEYVNGSLFADQIQTPYFDFDLRATLVKCAELDWSGISPAIFGSMFQAVLEKAGEDAEHRKESRRELGAHYTSERNILKVIQPLFLDELHEEFEKLKSNGPRKKLIEFYEKLPTLKFFDPACGCGNFLVIAYKELRRLENDVIGELLKDNAVGLLDVATLCKVNVGQFFGIEIDEAAAHIARVALYITDHQMNLESANKFGKTRATVPLVTTPHIHCENALRIDWSQILDAKECSYVFGNPPFIGHQWRNSEQIKDMDIVWGSDGQFGRLDYVTCWYKKVADYIDQNSQIEVAFVSTNSICQGEQVGILWPYMLSKNLKINFAHRSFQWSNEGRANATVQCVIIGFSKADKKAKFIFDYVNGVKEEPVKIKVSNINSYLVDAPNIILPSRTSTPAYLPKLTKGSQPTDGGNLFLSSSDCEKIIEDDQDLHPFVKKFIGGEELINGGDRWCLWLKDAPPSLLRKSPLIIDRLKKIAEFRSKSPTKSVKEYADKPYLFTQDRQPKGNYLALSRHSSENRKYIPIGFLNADVICGDSLLICEGAQLYHFGVMCSILHNSWVKYTCGKLESRYRYEPSVYNNFPWIVDITEESKEKIESAAQGVLNARSAHSESSLADLYDPLTMPPDLLQAHKLLDKSVEEIYGYKGNDDDASRVAFLFKLYEQFTSLLPATPIKKKRTKGANQGDLLI